MSDAKTKDTRLVVRLEADDLAYVREEGEKLSLDASTWVRMMIRKLRLGQIGEYQMRALGVERELDPNRGERMFTDEEMRERDAISDASEVDTDDLVARKMREAEQKGLTQPRAAADDDGMDDEFAAATGGIVPVGERQIWNTGKPKDFRAE